MTCIVKFCRCWAVAETFPSQNTLNSGQYNEGSDDFGPRYLWLNRNGSSKHSRFDRLTDFAAQAHNPQNTGQVLYQPEILFVIPRRSRRDIVLALSVCLSVHLYIRPSIPLSTLFVCPEPYLSTYFVRFDSFFVQMIITMDSQYPISLVKIDPLTLELFPLFWYRQL